MPRILSGKTRGRRLAGPRGGDVRPTGARVRQSLFDILSARIDGARLLDLCAGTGAVGLEALSRGASRVVFVDRAQGAVGLVQRNLQAMGVAPSRAWVLRQDALLALKGLGRSGEAFDIVFFDPPYESGVYEPALESMGEGRLLAEGSVVIAEHFHKRALPETIGALVRTRQVKVGDHVLSFYGRKDGA